MTPPSRLGSQTINETRSLRCSIMHSFQGFGWSCSVVLQLRGSGRSLWSSYCLGRAADRKPEKGLRVPQLVRRPGLVAGITLKLQRAVGASRFAGDANLSSVVNNLMRELNPLVLRQNLHEVLLYLYRVGCFGQLKSL